MAFRDIVVEGVEYRLILRGKNKDNSRKKPLEGLDALVLDTKLFHPEKEDLDSSLEIVKHHLDHLQENDIPIYTVNPSFKEGKLISDYIHHANGFHGMVVPSILLGFSALFTSLPFAAAFSLFVGTYANNVNSSVEFSKRNSIMDKLGEKFFSTYSLLDCVCQSPANEGINAIAATKIKYGVVPRLLDQKREEYAQRAPRIAIIYDGVHRGLLQSLKSDFRPRITSYVQQLTQLYRVMEQNSLTSMQEYRISEEGNLTSQVIDLPYQPRMKEVLLDPPPLITDKSL